MASIRSKGVGGLNKSGRVLLTIGVASQNVIRVTLVVWEAMPIASMSDLMEKIAKNKIIILKAIYSFGCLLTAGHGFNNTLHTNQNAISLCESVLLFS